MALPDEWKQIMLPFLRIVVKSLRIAVIAIVLDSILAYVIMLYGFGFVEIFGDLMLVETAILLIIAGLIDFSSSIGAAQLRRVILHSKQEYSDAAHKEAERRAFAFFIAGLVLFATLIALAIITRA